MGVEDMPGVRRDKSNGEALLRFRRLLMEETDEDHSLSTSDIIRIMENEGYSISQRTIRSYIEYLNREEIGDYLTIEVQKDGKELSYHVTESLFEPAEVNILCDAVSNSHFITETRTEDLLRKLRELVSRRQAGKLHGMSDVDRLLKVNNRSSYTVLSLLWEAISRNRCITFHYMTWSSDKQLIEKNPGKLYEVSPWEVVWSEEEYYLMAYRHDRMCRSTFRVDKMKDVQLLDKPRLGAEEFAHMDFDLYSVRTFGMFDSTQKGVDVVCPQKKCGIFIDRFGKDIQILKNGDGTCRIHIQVSANPLFYGWVTGLGDDVRITGPEDVLAEYRSLLKKKLSGI